MPHGRHKVPFSGKAKKEQLKAKKQRQQHVKDNDTGRKMKNYLLGNSSDSEEFNVQSLNQQPSHKPGKSNPNRYNLRFHRETEAEIQEKKELARKTLVPIAEKDLEIHLESFFPPELNFPIRPPWDLSMSKAELDARENRYFTEYVKSVEQKYSWSELSYFELNLETWRQLWRVLEMSDILLLIADIRFPALMFPPHLYTYVTQTLKKEIILVLNKIDLAPAPLVVAWKDYLTNKYPCLHIIMFTSYPAYNLRNASGGKTGLQVRRQKGKMKMAAEGAQQLFETCQSIVKGEVDLKPWQDKISEEMSLEHDIGDEEVEIGETVNLKQQDTSYREHNRYEGGILTIGCVGQPNVGKSSLMNALMGKKVVSVSKTPGHTKHFQTIFLTKTVRLCDCPGLVFPSKVPKALQVLMGSFPIAQLRDPYSCVQFLAERVDLVHLLKILHPEQDDQWSAMDICDGWAKKKGFYTARAARLDTYRAANHLLRIALDGKIPLCLLPPGYTQSKDTWASHPEVETVRWIQAASQDTPQPSRVLSLEEESTSEEEEEQGASGQPSTHTDLSQSEESLSEEHGSLQTTLNKFQALDTSD